MLIVFKLLRIIGLMALAALCAGALTACSALKLGYAAAPEFAFWQLDAYLDLDLLWRKNMNSADRDQLWFMTGIRMNLDRQSRRLFF